MRINPSFRRGLTLVEISVTSGLVGVLGLVIYSLLNMGTILGAKNTAMNTAHQHARVAMLKMIEDIHSSVSLPKLENQGSKISFQQWGAAIKNGVMTPNGGPHKIIADANLGDLDIHIQVAPNQPKPIVGQRIIVPTHQIEVTITGTSGSTSNLQLDFTTPLPVAINGTASTAGDLVCYITDRCDYRVVEVSAGPPAVYKLQWTNNQVIRDIVNDVTNPRPFSVPTTPGGAMHYRFVAAIDLSTSDAKYSRRGYKSANILLNGQVPFKARLTAYQ